MTSIDTSNVTMKAMVNAIDLGPGASSIQFQFAKLQLLLAETNKSQAMAYMDEITGAQDKAKECAAMIEQARKVQSNKGWTSDANVSTDKWHADCKAIQQYCQANGLTYTSADNSDNWDAIITSLKSHQEQIGTDTQQKMVFLQDFMGQYNSYLTGANSAIQQANQTLQAIARGQ